MAERDFQAVLLHLYRTADRDGSGTAALPACFALSASEQAWIEELIASQRDRLRFISARLRTKRWRFLWHALPGSRDAFPELLEALLQNWSCESPLKGAIDGPDTVRNFATYVKGQERVGASKALAFIRFDACCAAVTLSPYERDRPEVLSPTLRLGLAEDADLIWCDYDVLALQDPALLEKAEPLPTPQPALLFRQQGGDVRIFATSPGLAAALRRFSGGACVGEVLEATEPGAARDALSHGLTRLLLLGVPFFVPAHSKAPAGAVSR